MKMLTMQMLLTCNYTLHMLTYFHIKKIYNLNKYINVKKLLEVENGNWENFPIVDYWFKMYFEWNYK